MQKTEIQKFYSGCYVFITGATGFLGKILIEKLLRSCPDIGGLYLLIRKKKGKDFQQRCNEIFDDQIFLTLKGINPNFSSKIKAIAGDCCLPGLGISSEDAQELREKVNIIFHVAATVRFDEKLHMAYAINVRGTEAVLDIARSATNLKALVHVSTAFTYCYRKEIQEQFYESPIGPAKLKALLDVLSEEEVNGLTSKICGNYPNTYALTKAVAEDCVRTCSSGLPICIVRPGMVTSTSKEPVKGWVDNVYGPTGIALGTAVGILRCMVVDKDAVSELVPVDYCINNIIAAAWSVGIRKPKAIPIYNYISSADNPTTWGSFMKCLSKYGIETPALACVWYYSLTLTTCVPYFWLLSIINHWIPALIVDTYLLCATGKPKFLNITRKVHKFMGVLAYFSTRSWKFENNHVHELWNSMSEADKKLFFFDMKSHDWEDYYSYYLLGMRIHLIKEDISTLPAAKKWYKKLYYLDRLVRGLCILLMLFTAWWLLKLLV